MYALVDCNNFYCSCERAFQPHLEGRPLVVLSNNDGCIIARSQEAKDLGIEMGTPYFKREEWMKQNGVVPKSINYPLYDDMSTRVMVTLGRVVPELEIYSIDEAFLNMFNLYKVNLYELACAIRQTIRRNQGIPVCIGIAPTKTLAKLANRYAKKMTPKNVGVYLADTPEKIQQMLAWADVKDIWGVGPQYVKLLRANGINTAAEFVNASADFIRDKMTVVGLRTWKELKGTPCIPWEFEAPDKQNITTSRSFGKMLEEKRVVAEAVAEYASRCAEKARMQGSVAGIVNVFVQTNPHRSELAQYNRSIQVKLEVASNDTPSLVKAAEQGLERIWRDGYQYMKAGVVLYNLVPQNAVQGGLFDDRDKGKLKAAMQAMDGINQHYKRDTIKIATMGQEREYAMRSAFLSQRFTTRISDVIKANKH